MPLHGKAGKVLPGVLLTFILSSPGNHVAFKKSVRQISDSMIGCCVAVGLLQRLRGDL
jgi:hypothetical protein